MSIEKLKEKARRHEQDEEWRKALENYNLALTELARDDQVDIGLYNRVGDLYVRVGDFEKAVEHYDKAIDLYREAYLPNNAIAVCKKIIRNVPQRHRPYLVIGQIRAEQGFLPDARSNFLTYAERVAQSGDLEESFRALVEFCDLAPDDAGVRVTVAEQMASSGRVDEAVQQYRIARQHFVGLGDTEQADEIGAKMLELDPEADLAVVAAVAFDESPGAAEDALAGYGEVTFADEPVEASDGAGVGGLEVETVADAVGGGEDADDDAEGGEELPMMSFDDGPESFAEPGMVSFDEPAEASPEETAGSFEEPVAPVFEEAAALSEDEPDVGTGEGAEEVEELPLMSFDDDVEGVEELPMISFDDDVEGAVDLPMMEIPEDESESAAAMQEAVEEAVSAPAAESTVAPAGEAPTPAPEPSAPVEEAPTLRPPAAEPASSGDGQDYVDLGAMILGEPEEQKSTRFTVAYEEPTGDEAADFARMLSQFKQKVSENIDSSDVRAHYDLGTAYKEMGLLDEAISAFQAALRASPDHLPTYELMGQTFMEMGQADAAVRTLQRAVEVNPGVEDELVGIYYYLARAHEALANKEAAVEFYDRVFALDINFADVTERLRELR